MKQTSTPKLGTVKIKILDLRIIKEGETKGRKWKIMGLTSEDGFHYTYFDSSWNQGWNIGDEITVNVSEDSYTDKSGNPRIGYKLKEVSASELFNVHDKKIVWLYEEIMRIKSLLEIKDEI